MIINFVKSFFHILYLLEKTLDINWCDCRWGKVDFLHQFYNWGCLFLHIFKFVLMQLGFVRCIKCDAWEPLLLNGFWLNLLKFSSDCCHGLLLFDGWQGGKCLLLLHNVCLNCSDMIINSMNFGGILEVHPEFEAILHHPCKLCDPHLPIFQSLLCHHIFLLQRLF